MPHLLVEIGTEELPSGILDVIYAELPRKAAEVFEKNRLPFQKVFVQATPRRIALYLELSASSQKDQALEFSGPSIEKSYDAEGKPTPAL